MGDLCCIICDEILNDSIIYMNCDCKSSAYHNKCINEWLDKSISCPTCRKIFPTKLVADNDDTGSDSDNDNDNDNNRHITELEAALFYDSIRRYRLF
jgi:hypothetical protein